MAHVHKNMVILLYFFLAQHLKNTHTCLPVLLEPDFSPHPEIMCLPTVVTHPFNFLLQTGLETPNTKPLFLHEYMH